MSSEQHLPVALAQVWGVQQAAGSLLHRCLRHLPACPDQHLESAVLRPPRWHLAAWDEAVHHQGLEDHRRAWAGVDHRQAWADHRQGLEDHRRASWADHRQAWEDHHQDLWADHHQDLEGHRRASWDGAVHHRVKASKAPILRCTGTPQG